MNEHDITSQVAGKLVWEPQGMYYRFEPNDLPLPFTETSELSLQAQKTMGALCRLDGLTYKFTKAELSLFLLPFMVKEAQLSSEIEGTRSTISDVYKEEKIRELDPEKRLDNQEIRNYQEALMWALSNLGTKINEQFIKDIHKKLLAGVRGENKNPGMYKVDQNAIGKREDTLDSAKFVPASATTTPHLMYNLTEFINNEKISPLYKIAMVHYQFEAIHAFRDGNGRLGRMLIVLELCQERILSHPLLYISEYLTRNKDKYVEALFEVSAKGKVNEWLTFMLKALEVQAEKSLQLLTNIDAYKNELHDKMQTISQSPRMHTFIDLLFKHPFFTVQDVVETLKVSQPAAWNLTQKLINENIAEFHAQEGRQKVYLAHNVIRLLEGKSLKK